MFATGLARHGPEIVQYLALPLTIPYFVVVWLDLATDFWWITVVIPAFVYWYIIFSICDYLRSRFR